MIESCNYKKYKVDADAFDIFSLFCNRPYCFFLDSSLKNVSSSRYSFIGFDPFDVFEAKDAKELCSLRRKFNKYQLPRQYWPTPFPAGLMGFFSYDFGLTFERLKRSIPSELNGSECLFGFYDTVITIDHQRKTLIITSTGLPETNTSMREKRSRQRLKMIEKRLSQLRPKKEWEGSPFDSDDLRINTERMISNFTKGDYLQAVQKARDYIEQGDIYQVNLSQKFQCPFVNDFSNSLAGLYQRLRELSPSSFGAYFDAQSLRILCTSPEEFVKINGQKIWTRPMKGTRPRGSDAQKDNLLRKELLASSKERAELMMITDMLRNDLGRICRFGSVNVRQLRTLEAYATVFQTTSWIEGILDRNRDVFDVWEALLPGGSITGCPKIRAMEIIEELEPSRRSLYTGTLGYLSFTGNVNFNILIRTALARRNTLSFQVGGGIVADSDPEREYAETLVKAKAMIQAMNKRALTAG